eukprot:g28186.t1
MNPQTLYALARSRRILSALPTRTHFRRDVCSFVLATPSRRFSSEAKPGPAAAQAESKQQETQHPPRPSKWFIAGEVVWGLLLAGSVLATAKYVFDWPQVCQIAVEDAEMDLRVRGMLGVPLKGSWLWSGSVDDIYASVSIPATLDSRLAINPQTNKWEVLATFVKFEGYPREVTLERDIVAWRVLPNEDDLPPAVKTDRQKAFELWKAEQPTELKSGSISTDFWKETSVPPPTLPSNTPLPEHEPKKDTPAAAASAAPASAVASTEKQKECEKPETLKRTSSNAVSHSDNSNRANQVSTQSQALDSIGFN